MEPRAILAGSAFVSFTTYTKDGRAKSTPVWIADLGDGTLGFTTASSSHKVRRLGNDHSCTLQPCTRKGDVIAGSKPVPAKATVSPNDLARVRAKIRDKYGFQAWAVGTLGKIMGAFGGSIADTAVIVTLTKPDAD